MHTRKCTQQYTTDTIWAVKNLLAVSLGYNTLIWFDSRSKNQQTERWERENFERWLGETARVVGGRFGIVVGITYQPLPWWRAVSDGLLAVMSMLGPRETPLSLTLNTTSPIDLLHEANTWPHIAVSYIQLFQFKTAFLGFLFKWRHEWTKKGLASTGG